MIVPSMIFLRRAAAAISASRRAVLAFCLKALPVVPQARAACVDHYRLELFLLLLDLLKRHEFFEVRAAAFFLGLALEVFFCADK